MIADSDDDNDTVIDTSDDLPLDATETLTPTATVLAITLIRMMTATPLPTRTS